MNDRFSGLLGSVFDDHRADLREALPREDYQKLRDAFIFHMTDWLDDLDRLSEMRRDPGAWPKDEAMSFLIGMLYHVVPHLKAAGRLLLDGVGDAFEGDEVDRLLAKAHRDGAHAS